MSYLVDSMEPSLTLPPLYPWGYHNILVLCDDKYIGRKYGEAILRGLLSQILHQHHDLIEYITASISKIDPGQ